MPDDIKSLSQRQDTLEKQFSEFIKEWHDQQSTLFKRMEEIEERTNVKREQSTRELALKIDAMKENDKPNLLVIYTGLGVLVAIFAIVAAGLMWGVDREFAHVKDDIGASRESLQLQINSESMRTVRLEKWQDDSVARALDELQQRRMKDIQ